MALDTEKLVAGDRDEWRRAVRHARALALRKRSRLPEVEAGDVAQEACFRLHQLLQRSQERTSDAAGALHRTVRLALIDQMREAARNRPDEAAWRQAMDAGLADMNELLRRQELLAGPRLRQRLAWTLATVEGELLKRWVGGERLVDLQQVTGHSVPTLQRKIHAAAQALQACMEEDASDGLREAKHG